MKSRHYLVTGSSGTLGSALVSAVDRQYSGEAVLSLPDRSQMSAGMMSLTGYVLEQVTLHGPLHGVVHLAGSEVLMPLRLTKDDAYAYAMFAADTAFAILRACASKHAACDGCSIVLMSSVAASRGTPGLAAYSAGKAAIEAMARCAALELAPRSIRVNCVAAGAFTGKMHTRITRHQTESSIAAYEAKHPLGVGDPTDVVKALLYLLSDDSKWVTGTTLTVDGGFSA